MAKNWSDSEVKATVADYFSMLRSELTSKKYNKTAHRRTLLEKLNDRTHSAIELKHQNISAVLIEMGIPYIDGYKPRFNYQKFLQKAINEYLKSNPDIHKLFSIDSNAVFPVPSIDDFLSAWENPPTMGNIEELTVREPITNYNPFGVNYLEMEARNTSLGEAGEQFVINFERARLIHAGKENLADRIEQVSTTVGPSAGFDIKSFEENGTDRFIEAKTTKYGKSTPFFVTKNELQFSLNHSSKYFLYRVFKFREEPRLFSLQGNLESSCIIEPSEFIARPAT